MQRYSFDVDDNLLFTLGQAAAPQIRFPINQPPIAVLPAVPLATADERLAEVVDAPQGWKQSLQEYEASTVVEASKLYPIFSVPRRPTRIAKKILSTVLVGPLCIAAILLPMWLSDRPNPQEEFVSAAGCGDRSTVQSMVMHGTDVNTSDESGMTALAKASERGNEQIAQFLLSHGADPNRGDNFQETPLMHAASYSYGVIPILAASSANVNAVDANHATALVYAATFDNPKAAEVLLADNADPNIAEYDGWTPLMEAAKANSSSVAHVLLDHGALASARNRRGETAADVAIRYQHPEMADMLNHPSRNVVWRSKPGD